MIEENISEENMIEENTSEENNIQAIYPIMLEYTQNVPQVLLDYLEANEIPHVDTYMNRSECMQRPEGTYYTLSKYTNIVHIKNANDTIRSELEELVGQYNAQNKENGEKLTILPTDIHRIS